MIKRRALLTGLVAAGVTAPAIVRAGSLMPVKVVLPAWESRPLRWLRCDGRWVEKALYPQLYGVLQNDHGSLTHFKLPDVGHLGPPGFHYHLAAQRDAEMPVGAMVLLMIGDDNG